MEHYSQPLVSKTVLIQRLLYCIFFGVTLLLLTILGGASVYHCVEHQPWVDAILNAVMIMSGLGLAEKLTTDVGKIFTSFYAVISTIIFFAVLGIIFSPLVHRFLHRFHLELDQ